MDYFKRYIERISCLNNQINFFARLLWISFKKQSDDHAQKIFQARRQL